MPAQDCARQPLVAPQPEHGDGLGLELALVLRVRREAVKGACERAIAHFAHKPDSRRHYVFPHQIMHCLQFLRRLFAVRPSLRGICFVYPTSKGRQQSPPVLPASKPCRPHPLSPLFACKMVPSSEAR